MRLLKAPSSWKSGKIEEASAEDPGVPEAEDADVYPLKKNSLLTWADAMRSPLAAGRFLSAFCGFVTGRGSFKSGFLLGLAP